jgi:hypothetical protein
MREPEVCFPLLTGLFLSGRCDTTFAPEGGIMKRIVLLIFLCLAMAGCSTKAQLVPQTESGKTIMADSFAISGVEDRSGYAFESAEENFSLAEAMRTALNKALTKEHLERADSEYVLVTTIVSYSPGNAFKRWLLPGAGATELKTETAIMDREGTVLATVPVERSIAAGGGYTIGAWMYVFDDVAEATVDVLKTVVRQDVAVK